MGSECGLSKADIQVREALGWADYQVRSDKAMRRHWQLVCCAFSFCWYHASHPAASSVAEPEQGTQASGVEVSEVPASKEDTGKKKQRDIPTTTRGALARRMARRSRVMR